MMLVNIDEEGKCLVAIYAPSNNHHYPAQSVQQQSNIAQSMHNTNSLKLCRYKKPGYVLVAANTVCPLEYQSFVLHGYTTVSAGP